MEVVQSDQKLAKTVSEKIVKRRDCIGVKFLKTSQRKLKEREKAILGEIYIHSFLQRALASPGEVEAKLSRKPQYNRL